MFVIFILLLTTVLAHSHEKYIDLLPEEEKQQFLDKVARRIMETVEDVDDGNKFSRELTDEQLKGHSKFVQEILKQESALFRKRKTDSKGSKDENKAEENVEVIPLNSGERNMKNANNSVQIDTVGTNNNVNLTVKNIKRRSYDEIPQETSTSFIKVDTEIQNSLPMQKRSVRSDGESNEKEVIEQLPIKTSKEGELSTDKSKDPATSTTHSNTQTDEPEDEQPTTESQDLITENTNYTSMTDAPETNYKILRATGSNHEHLDSKEENVAETNVQAIPNDRNHTLRSTINENKTQAEVNGSFTEHKSPENHTNEGNSVTTEKYSEKNSTTSPKLDESYRNETITATTSKKSIFIDLSDYSTPTPSTTKLNIATTVNYHEPVSEITLPGVKLPAITATTTVLPALTPKSQQKKTSKNIKKPRIVKKTENITFISYIASNALKNVKSKYELKQKSKPIQKKYDVMTTKSDRNFGPYHIYEVPYPKSSEDPPFRRSPEPMQDSPLFVPVYKYSPNYAYYNPTNRLGPNAVEENSIELDTDPLRKGKHKIGERPVPSEFILRLNNKFRKFREYKKKEKEYGDDFPAVTAKPTEENSESDEKSEEDTSKFPNSNEKSHPINSMKKGMKTHIKAIRDILFKQKIFGPKGPEKRDELVHDLYGNDDILYKYGLKNDTNSFEKYEDGKHSEEMYWKKKKITKLRNYYDQKKDLDIDYYFGIMNPLSYKINKHIKGLSRFRAQNNDKKHKNRDVLIMNYFKDKHHKLKKLEGNKKTDHLNTIAKKLRPVVIKAAFNNPQKIQELRSNLQEKNDVSKVSIYTKALKDLMEQDSKALKQYGWLATTVQIQSALAKLFKLIQKIREREPIHPADVQILKYTAFLHNFSLELKGADIFKTQLRKHVKLLPKNKRKKKDKLLKEKGLINRVWLYLRRLLPNLTSDDGLNDLNEFLLDVEKALHDLHEAITNISKVTSFKKQNWYENLRQLYLTTGENHLRELLLHISFTRLIELIELGHANGLEKDFIGYMKTNREESKRTLAEMVFVTKIMDEIKNSAKL